MKRYLLLVAIAGCVATPLAAEESNRFTDEDDAALGSMLSSDLELISQPLLLNGDGGTETEPVRYGAFAPDDGTNASDNTGDGEAENLEKKNEKERPFRPVCDCGCHTPCLDHWCVCDVTCCGTPCASHPCQGSHGNCYLTEDGNWVCDDACCDVWGPPVYRSNAAVRFGWWAVGTDGSENKTGEFQDLDSSPF